MSPFHKPCIILYRRRFFVANICILFYQLKLIPLHGWNAAGCKAVQMLFSPVVKGLCTSMKAFVILPLRFILLTSTHHPHINLYVYFTDHLFISSFFRPFIHSFMHAFIHSFIHSFIHPLVYLFLLVSLCSLLTPTTTVSLQCSLERE